MAILGPTTPISARTKRVMVQNPGPAAPNGDGGFTLSWTDLPPAADARIAPATQSALERLAAGTAITTATHVVTIPYRGGVSTKSRLIFDGRTLNVTSVQDPD